MLEAVRLYILRQVFHSPQTCGVTVVVGNDDGRVERLEVQHQYRVGVESRLRLQNQWKTLGSSLSTEKIQSRSLTLIIC